MTFVLAFIYFSVFRTFGQPAPCTVIPSGSFIEICVNSQCFNATNEDRPSGQIVGECTSVIDSSGTTSVIYDCGENGIGSVKTYNTLDCSGEIKETRRIFLKNGQCVTRQCGSGNINIYGEDKCENSVVQTDNYWLVWHGDNELNCIDKSITFCDGETTIFRFYDDIDCNSNWKAEIKIPTLCEPATQNGFYEQVFANNNPCHVKLIPTQPPNTSSNCQNKANEINELRKQYRQQCTWSNGRNIRHYNSFRYQV